MFTGIIEAMGKVIDVTPKGSSIHLTMESPISNELKIDQSLSHNGVCLTVTDQNDLTHEVTIVKESLDRSNLGKLRLNSEVNLERAMHFNGRLDGHLVQGHVDDTAICIAIEDLHGSRWPYQSDFLIAGTQYSNQQQAQGNRYAVPAPTGAV